MDLKAPPFISTKSFFNFPCCHRQWRHEGHCKFIHGYSRSFHFWFACKELSPEHFVVDFGALKELKQWLVHMFDHTTLINADDPELPLFRDLHVKQIVDLRVMPNVSMEGTSKFVFDYADELVRRMTQDRAWVLKVETKENKANSAFYSPYTTLDC